MKEFFDELDGELKDETAEPQSLRPLEEDVLWPEQIFEEADDDFELDTDEGQDVGTGQVFTKEGNQGPRQNPLSRFPITKFYLPTLRDGYTRVIPVGGNNETWSKNMDMFQYGEDILLVDCGVQFAEPDMLGANYSVPDISFLIPYKDKIKGLIVTHAHLDHIGAIKHILPALGMPTIFATKLTIGIIKKWLAEARLLDYATLVEVDADKLERVNIGKFTVEFFRVNHSVPDCAGLCIETPGGARIIHTGDFKIDFTPTLDKPFDLARLGELGRQWVTLLMSDSTAATKKWFSKSEKEIGETLEKIIANHKKGRLIITMFSSWISRVQQILNACEKHDKSVFLSGRSLVENIDIAKELQFLKFRPQLLKKMTGKVVEGIPLEKQVIITTGSQGEEFSALTRMAEGKHPSIEILKGDTIVFSSSVVPGNERSVVAVINKLIRLGATVITKDDGEVHTGGHAQQEEQKIVMNLSKPKYFMPIYGDLYFRTAHKATAVAMGIPEDNVLLLDNGNIVDFAPDGNVFRSRIKAPIQDIIIDGNGIGTATSHVIKAREKMMNSWVLVLMYKVDAKSKAILGHIKLETRGLVYLEEVRHIHRMIIKKSRDVYENTVKDVPDIEEKDLVRIIRTDLEAFLLQRIDREPMIIPMIFEV